MFFGWDDPLAAAAYIVAGLFALKITAIEAIDTYVVIAQKINEHRARRNKTRRR